MNEHNFDLNSGERQTALSYEAIRADHRYRYEWADKKISRQGYGLDIFCGNGYGTWLLGKDRNILGIDGCNAAIDIANTYYKTNTTLFSYAQYPFNLPLKVFDFIVALESIEHVADGYSFFQSLCCALKPGGEIVFSTPCEEYLPHNSTGNHFHYKHYQFNEILQMIQSNQLEVIEYCGQNTYEIDLNGKQGNLISEKEMMLQPYSKGQFVTFYCKKASL